MTGERLQKILARAGIASRRHAEVLILTGRVAVDGNIIRELGSKADPDRQQITVDGRPIRSQDQHLYLAFNKPPGVIVSLGDPFGRPELSAYLPSDRRLFPVGRLDARSEGLLLLTTDGDFALRVTHPRYGCEKEYLVWTQPLTAQTFQRIRDPILLTDGLAQFHSIHLVRRTTTENIVAVVLTEGRKREIRRMFEAWTLPVHRLQRIRIGTVKLGRLPLGHYRSLTDQEVAWFLDNYRALGSRQERPHNGPDSIHDHD
ncbi:MAG: rRNA pseudouridine synthase [Chloroflexi bacterium]|nr:rRNA pseudouridine synthase [Chloroflexota bacterium]